MVGASNTKYLSSKYTAGHDSWEKKCTVEEAADCIYDYEGDEPIGKARNNSRIESSLWCT